MTTTTTISTINRADVKMINAEAKAALIAIAEKYGLTYTHKGGTFNSSIAHVGGEFCVADAKRNAFNSVIRYLVDENQIGRASCRERV